MENKVISKGDYDYALVPNHPFATKNGYVLLHRIIMENHLNRLLTANEVVHHKDNNKKNNKISNLELLSSTEHTKLHQHKKGREYVLLKCPVCNTIFEMPRNKTYLNKPHKYNCMCCSNHCRGVLYSYIQNYGLTNKIKKQISACLQKEYKKYVE